MNEDSNFRKKENFVKILITGAHFTPAQAVIEELQKRYRVQGTGDSEKLQIVYVGRKTTMEGDKTPSVESEVLPKIGVHFIPITTGRIRRFLSLGTFLSLLKIPIGFVQGFWIVMTEQPDIVVSFGGYVAVPIVFWAWMFNIPVLIHEQTLVSGLANTVSSYFATKIAVTFEAKYPFNKNKLIVTGNPMRSAILAKVNQPSAEIKKILDFKAKKKMSLILITGGNQGSHLLNQAISEKLPNLTQKYLIVHQTGDSKYNDFDNLTENAKLLANPDHYLLTKFMPAEDMAAVLKNADLAVSRAGANTLLELAFLGVPTIIVPIPYLSKNEQVKNAKFFAEAFLGEVIYQSEFSADKLTQKIAAMIKNRQMYRKNAQMAQKVVIPDATLKLTQEILKMINHV